jgi:hypothetical protein
MAAGPGIARGSRDNLTDCRNRHNMPSQPTACGRA